MKKKLCSGIFMAIIGFAILNGGLNIAAMRPAQEPPKPDNTAVNKGDRDPSQPNADRQKQDRKDVDLAKEIRKAIVADKSLSTYAHNVKVIAQDGNVTLRGPVRTQEEKAAVEEKAAQVAGQANVKSEITVVPPSELSGNAHSEPRPPALGLVDDLGVSLGSSLLNIAS